MSKKHLCVYGVVTEDKKGIGIVQLHLNKNKRLTHSPYLRPSYVFKPLIEKWKIEATIDENEAIEFLNGCGKLKKLGLKSD